MRQPRLFLAAALVLCLAALRAGAAINGTVMTPDGQPVAGARVSLLAFETVEARRTRLLSATPEAVPLASAQTDAKGNFSLASPKEPSVDLTIFAPGYEPAQQRVERDEEVGAIALLRSEMRSGSVSAAGKAVAGATVVINYRGYEYVTKTGEDGKYTAPDPKRARNITVIHPKYAIHEENLLLAGAGQARLNRTLTTGTPVRGKVVGTDGQTAAAGASVTLDGWPLATSGEDGTFTIANAIPRWTSLVARKDALLGQRAFTRDASHTIRLAGTATISGRIVDARTKTGVAGAVVSAVTGGFGRMFGGAEGTATAMTDAKGSFTFVVPPASYTLIAGHPAFDTNQTTVSVAASQRASKELSLKQLARVSGVVVDEERKPVAAAAISSEVVDDPSMGMMRMMRMSSGSAASGPDGRFTIRFGGDEDLRIKAAKRGLPVTKSETMKLASGERKSGLVLTIPSGVAVAGVVTDGEGKPLSGVAVTAAEAEQGTRGMMRVVIGGLPSDDEDPVRSGSDGSFSMRLKEGTYDFAFRREGFATQNVRGKTVSATGENVVEAKMNPAVEIRGRVTRNGAGVEGVMLFAMMAGTEGRATTASDGSFTLGGLSPGQTRISLRKDDEFIQDMRMYTAPASDVVIDLPAGGRVTGRVVEKGTSKPVTQFQAGLTRSRSGGGMVMMAPPQMKSFTSDDGSFTLENVPAGAHDLTASAPGYAGGRTNVTIEEGKTVSDVVIELDTGVKLTGKVTGPNGQPLSDVTVNVAIGPGGMFARTGSESRTSTDTNGEYSLDTLQQGEETIEFSHPKYISTRKAVTLKDREQRLDAQLSGGQTVTGTVVTEAGAPVGDVEVRAIASGASSKSVRTNASGMFEFDSLAPARYRFTASKTGFADGVVEDFDIAGSGSVRITLRTGGTLYGRVSGLSADDYASTMVQARGGRSFTSANVDSSGNYRMEGAPTGTVQVTAQIMSRSFGTRSTPVQTVEIEAGGSRQLDLEFRSDITISGRVTRNGTPMASASIAFMPRAGRSQAVSSGTTDNDGNYSVTGIEEGEYSVMVVDMQRFNPHTTNYQVRGSATFDIDYQTSGLRGRVIDATNNTPIADATVNLRAADGSEGFRGSRAAMTDSTGTFAFDSITAGSYVVNAVKDSYGNDARNVTIGDRATELELKLTKNDGVILKVVDARDGRGLDGLVSVYDAQGRVVHESRMRFGGSGGSSDASIAIAPGSYTASVSSFGYAMRSVTLQSPSTQTIALTPGGTIAIRSRHSTPSRVRLIDANGAIYPRSSMRPPFTDLNPSPGTTTLEYITPGTYTLQLLGTNDIVLDSVRVQVYEGQVAQTEI